MHFRKRFTSNGQCSQALERVWMEWPSDGVGGTFLKLIDGRVALVEITGVITVVTYPAGLYDVEGATRVLQFHWRGKDIYRAKHTLVPRRGSIIDALSTKAVPMVGENLARREPDQCIYAWCARRCRRTFDVPRRQSRPSRDPYRREPRANASEVSGRAAGPEDSDSHRGLQRQPVVM